MKSIAVILARGGSKRLPGKNQRIFFGKPLVSWTIEAALHSNCFDRVLLSTDSEEIARIGIKYGAEVPFLRNAAFDDHASSSEATLVALDQAETYWDESYKTVAQLMANCPLRSSLNLRESMSNFARADAPSQISCFKFGWMNPWWAAQLMPDGQPKWIFPREMQSRSQDLPALYCPSGAIWISTVQSLREYKSFYAPGHVFDVMDWMYAMDIDDDEDWAMAESCKLYLQTLKNT